MSSEALAAPIGSGWVARLGATVRQEFRAEVLVPAVGIRFSGRPRARCPGVCGRVATLGCARPIWAAGEGWSPGPASVGGDRRSRGDGSPAAAVVPCAQCGFGRHRYRLCYRHSRATGTDARPAVDQWKPQVAGTGGGAPSPGARCGPNWTAAGVISTTFGGGSVVARRRVRALLRQLR